jgi:glycosyltransferase involved in cell wall biosynthesis
MAQTLNAEGIAVDLMLIGAGPARDDLAENTPEHVHLYGHVADIHDYIDVCDIGILPSFFVGESMPLVLLEMMGLGKPIVATDAGEIPSILGVGEDEAGRVVPLQDGAELDVPAFTEAIRQLATAPEERERLGSAARTRFETHYTIEQMMQTYLAKYREIIAMRAKRQPDAEGDLQ